MHACGDLREHLIELVDVGVDVLDNKQPSLWMDCPAVDDVRGKISFSTCVDIQSKMDSIKNEEISQEVEKLIKRLSTESGGFLGTFYHQADLSFSAEKNSLMVDCFKQYSWK